jgi:hypothetical protein
MDVEEKNGCENKPGAPVSDEHLRELGVYPQAIKLVVSHEGPEVSDNEVVTLRLSDDVAVALRQAAEKMGVDLVALVAHSLGYVLYPRQEPRVDTMVQEIDSTLSERRTRYGEFHEHARITQAIKAAMQSGRSWSACTDSQKEALEMVAHKIGRIVNGDPGYLDSWHDMIGYTRLVEKELTNAS